MIKIMAVFGTRPEAVKMCPLILQLKQRKEIECVLCLTGQHREMLRQITEAFQITADYDLDIMRPGQSLASITADVLNAVGKVIRKERPQLLLVHGDTSSAFAAALSGFYEGIPVGHVEAGLRTFDLHAPFPEEFNRQAIDLIAQLCFAPTQTARQNLLREGKADRKIYVTGNTVIDALATTVTDSYHNENLDWAKDSRLILFTAHRRENLGRPMENMLRALLRITQQFPDVKVIYPVHRNPKIREKVERILKNQKNIRLTEPLDVFDFHNYMARSYLILTDSGGIQEEAPALGRPVLVMRDTTERPEGVEAGTLRLTGTGEDSIFAEVSRLLTDSAAYNAMSRAVNPYGDGHASERITEAILACSRERKTENENLSCHNIQS